MKTTSITLSKRRISPTDKIFVEVVDTVSSVRLSPHSTTTLHAAKADDHAVIIQTKKEKKVGRNEKKETASDKAGNSPTQKCLRTIKRSTFKMRRRFPLPTLLLFLLFTLFIVTVHAVPVASTDSETDEVSTTTKSTKTTTSTDKPTSTTTDKDEASTTKSTAKPTKDPASELVENTLLPKNILPFETLGENFTVATCQPFITNTIASQEYRDCIAFSPLIQNSRTFIAAQGTPSTITTFLDASCSAPLDTCTNLFHRLSRDIRSDLHCGADLRLRNPIVVQAYAAFIAYNPLRTAGCLKNPDTDSYCYVEAVEAAGKGKGGDLGLYGLPLDEVVPENWGISCGECTRGTMEAYSLFAGNKSQPLSGRYEEAAKHINGGCGGIFVNETAAPLGSGAASLGRGGRGMSMLGMAVVVFASALLL